MTPPIVQRLRDAASADARVGRHARARLSPLAIACRRSETALAFGLKAAFVVMPIPFGNLLPALALVFIGQGLGLSLNGTDR